MNKMPELLTSSSGSEFSKSDAGHYFFWDGKEYRIRRVVDSTTCICSRYFDIFEWLSYAVWKAWFIIKREIYYWYHREGPETRWYKGEKT